MIMVIIIVMTFISMMVIMIVMRRSYEITSDHTRSCGIKCDHVRAYENI